MRLLHGDMLEVLPTLEENSIDAVVCDPPYELGFMGKAFDKRGISFKPETWAAVFRVLKPGGHMLAFGGTRTYHRIAVAIEDAGFEIRDTLLWLYGSGMPKSHNIAKALDKLAGKEGSYGAPKSAAHAGWIDRGRMRGDEGHEGYQRPWMKDEAAVDKNARVYEGATDLARQFDGWGTALKPAFEPIILARKPVEGTITQNVATWTTGGINIDDCRVPHASEADRAESEGKNQHTRYANPHSNVDVYSGNFPPRTDYSAEKGRWPANVLLSHDPRCQLIEGEGLHATAAR